MPMDAWTLTSALQKEQLSDKDGMKEDISLLSCTVSFTNKTCNNSAGGVLGIESITELLSSSVILLLQGKSLEDEGVVLIL